MTGQIFNVQRFSLHDGPGIRTTFFLTGCSLRCRWCHNPEGFASGLQWTKDLCVGCGACAVVCPNGVHRMDNGSHSIHRSLCDKCGRCVTACPTGALKMSQRSMTPEDAANLAALDKTFYRDRGGVSFSGGEALLQADFVAQTAALCLERGIPTAVVDTAGNVPWHAFETVLPYVRHFLFDVKAADPQLHLAGTGCTNQQILENLRKLDGQGARISIRIPVIPGWNDTEQQIAQIAQIIANLHSVDEVKLLPYHSLGRDKYEGLGLSTPPDFGAVDEGKLRRYSEIIKAICNY